MTTEDFIISWFCLVHDRMGKLPKRSDASRYRSELVTIRRPIYLKMHLAWVSALFNVLLTLNRLLEPEASLDDRLLHLTQYSL